MIVQAVAISAFTAALIWAAVSDFRTLEISNTVSIIAALAFLPAALAAGLVPTDIALHYGIGLAAFAIGAVLFARGWIGGGDVKLLAAAMVWLDPPHLLSYLLVMALFGGVLALAALAARRWPTVRRGLGNPVWLNSETGADQALPYGVAIAGAALWILPHLVVFPAAWKGMLT